MKKRQPELVQEPGLSLVSIDVKIDRRGRFSVAPLQVDDARRLRHSRIFRRNRTPAPGAGRPFGKDSATEGAANRHTNVTFRFSAPSVQLGNRQPMAVATATPFGETVEPEARPAAGLVCAFRFHADGSAEELDVDRPIAEQGGWLWLHFNLSDARAGQFLSSIPHLPASARALLVSTDERQRLHGDVTGVYGILADLVCVLDGVTQEIGFLHFAVAERLFVSSRRHHLSAVEATRHALRRGLKVETPPALLEVIAGQMIEAVDQFADKLAGHLDRAEEKILAEDESVDRHVISSARRMTVRLHRQLATLRAIIQRFEHDTGQSSNSVLRLHSERLAQRLNWLDTEIVELRDRSRLLQEEITLKAAEQTNRNLHVLSTVTTIFLPASLVAGIFGMNVAGLPLVHDKSGFLWAVVILVAASVLVYWSLKRWGILRR